MKNNKLKYCIVAICVLLCAAVRAQGFVHPGMLHNSDDLAFLRAKVLAGEEPWKTAWDSLKVSELAQPDYKPTPFAVVANGPYNNPDVGGREFVQDGGAAYTMALQWVVTGESAYAEKAIEIFNAWSATLDSVTNHNRQLKVGTAGIKYLNAAEIIKHTYKGWKESDRKLFEKMVMEVWYPVIEDWTPTYNGNWDAANIQTVLCIGIFMDRRDIFEKACKFAIDGDTNGSIKNYFYDNGQCQESGRDQQHVQMGLGFLGCAAEIAWKQGVDLYGVFDNRLYRGFEYTAKYLSGEEVPYEQYVTWFGKALFGTEISPSQRDKVFPVWERVYHHYHDRLGMEMPYTRKMIEKSRPETMVNQSFMPWGTLTSANLLSAQDKNPHILVHEGDKQAILEKVDKQDWAKSIYANMHEKVLPYVDRHQTDKEWILSRYLMNRVPGKRYTTVYSDENGQRLIKWEGDAPVPTVRVNTYLRSPITKGGTAYRKPTIEELVPNDTARLMYLYNPETKAKEWVDPEAYITSINGDINELAESAAILYWLTGEEKFATFAADILQQWAQGAYYQEPIVGPCRTGFLDMQTLGDASYRPLIVAYDFVKPFMKRKGYDLHYYETVFEKIASTLAFRGYWNNNWYAAESSTMVFAALSLEDAAKRDYYLQFFLERDTINGGCGQLALPSTVEKWLTHDGHWKEPGGYHNYPVSNLLIASLALENNGYSVFKEFPELFRASFAMMKYAFPNMSVSAFGDTGHASPGGASLEIGLIGAVKYGEKELDEMAASMEKLIEAGKYRRESAGFLGLLCYLPEIPKATSSFGWPRTGSLEFARYFLQRNGEDLKRGLMVGVQGATYNHNHCNGMAMELYGLGGIMGIDAGTGANYEHPTHRNYYSQWSAHNTVVAAGSSSSIPFSGAAGTKRIGQIELVAMEPMPDVKAISESFSFTETSYFDASTKTNQLRLLAIVRTSPTTGYYVDIYRSDNKIANDYVYHNVGNALALLDGNRKALATVPTSYPLIGNDYPGFRFYTDVEKLENWKENVTALFTIKKAGETDKFMQVLMPKENDRTYFRAFSPKAKTADFHDTTKPQPVLTVRTVKEAWSKPFVAVLEPFEGEGNQTIKEVVKVEKLCNKNHTVLKVTGWNNATQLIAQGNDCKTGIAGDGLVFTGYFGVVSFKENMLEKIYLGKGKEIGYGRFLLSLENEVGSAEVCFLGGNRMQINSNATIQLSIADGEVDESVIDKNPLIKGLRFERTKKGVKLTIPASTNAILKL